MFRKNQTTILFVGWNKKNQKFNIKGHIFVLKLAYLSVLLKNLSTKIYENISPHNCFHSSPCQTLDMPGQLNRIPIDAILCSYQLPLKINPCHIIDVIPVLLPVRDSWNYLTRYLCKHGYIWKEWICLNLFIIVIV